MSSSRAWRVQTPRPYQREKPWYWRTVDCIATLLKFGFCGLAFALFLIGLCSLLFLAN
jgi:hypothetical protein